jgi:hypothetical protein
MSPTKTFLVSFRRDTRWDVYPQQEPVVSVTVTITRGQKLTDEGKARMWASLLGDRRALASAICDAMAEQHPRHGGQVILVDFAEA